MTHAERTRWLAALTVWWLARPVGAAPVVCWASDPVRPGEIVVVQGGDFGRQPTVALSGADGTVALTPLQAARDCLKFLVPATWRPGAWRFTVEADGASSAPARLNAPDPWWQQGDAGAEASPGGWLRIFGKCLSYDSRAAVVLRGGGRETVLAPRQQDCWSLAVDLPATLAPAAYEVTVRNGYGVETAVAGLLTVAAHTPPWPATRFAAADYGAVGNDGFDDTAALQQALDTAAARGGGIVTLARGRFELNEPLRLPRRVLLQGAGRDLTQLYWRDTAEPYEALLTGTNSFGLEDLTIMAANHRYGILADGGDRPDAGQISLRRLHLHLNRFEQLQAEQAAKRFLPMPWEHALAFGGENVQVTDCEIFSSRSPFGFSGLRHALIRGNRCFEGDCSHMFGGEGIIFEDNVIEGGPIGRGGADYCNQLYFARNTVGMTPLADGEGFTTDGGGNQPVKLAAAAGTRVTFDADVNWDRWTRRGAVLPRLCIMDGTGAGQSRVLVSHEGRQAELASPWALAPDATSVLHVIPNNYVQNLLLDNRFHDVTLLQSYAWALDWIVSGNHFTRAGGVRVFTHPGDPAWYFQCLDNHIDVGNGFRGPVNSQPPEDSALAVASSQGRCQILRRNVLHNNARISVNGSARDVLVEHNLLQDADVGIDAGRSPRTLLWGNRCERVKEPLRGLVDAAWCQPADRLRCELSACRESLPAACDPALARLEQLAERDPRTPGLADDVRACVRQLVAALPPDCPQELLAALWGVRLTPMAGDKFRPLLAGQGGAGTVWLSLAPGVCALPGKLSLEFDSPAAGRVTNLRDLALNPGQERGLNVAVTVAPGVVGAFSVPTQWTVRGDGWTVGGHGRLQVGDEWCGALTQWAVCGPFPNQARNALDEHVIHGPERRLDLAATYDTPAGPRGWQTLNAAKLDFTAQFGAQRSAVAYAVAVLRARRPTPVQLDFVVAGHGVLEPSLNGQPWRVPNHYGRRFSRTLQAGDNVLLVKLANLDQAWTLEARLRSLDGAAPGDVTVVPVAQLADVPVLHPTPKPPPPAGTGLPGAAGVNWKLVYEDDFDRTRLGTDWGYGPGSWAEHPFEFGRGVLFAGKEMYSFMSWRHKVTLPLRVEYDVRAVGACVSRALLSKADEVGIFCGLDNKPVGYLLTCGRGGHTLTREARQVAASGPGVPGSEPDKWQHVVVQYVPPRLTLRLDGREVLAWDDPQWLAGADTFSFMGDAWSLPQLDNVRVYQAAP